MPKYIEDATTFQIVDDAGKAISSFSKIGMPPQTYEALKVANQPFEQAPEPRPEVGRREGLASFIQDLTGAPSNAAPVSSAPVAPMAQSNLQASTAPIPNMTKAKVLDTSAISGPQFEVPVAPRSQYSTASDVTNKQVFKEDKEALNQIKQAENLQINALEAEKNVAVKAAEAKAQALNAEQDAINAVQKKQTEQALANEQANAKAIQDYESAYQKYANQADAGIFGVEKGGNEILAGLSVALGAVGGALSGQGGNMALDIINKTVNANMEKLKNKIVAAKDRIGETKESGAQALADLNIQKAAIYDKIAQKASDLAVLNGSPLAMANADKLKGQLLAESAALKQNSVNMLRGVETTRMAEKEVNVGKQESLSIPGFGTAKTADDAKNMKEILQQSNAAKGGLDELIKLAKTGSALSPADRARSEVIRQTLVGQLRVPLTGPGTMSETDRALLEGVIADPLAFFSLTSSNITKLNELKGALDRSVATHAQAYGLAKKGLDLKPKS
jgi:hypothetical protein